jgi:DNA-binding response OmpR family regulator
MAPEEETVHFNPTLILAHGDPVYATLVGEAFRHHGWDVQLARSGPEARRLAQELGSAAVVLDTELHGESGWLTCDKLTHEQPQLRVILVASAVTPERRRFATFVGATCLVARYDGARVLVEQLCGTPLPAAG